MLYREEIDADLILSFGVVEDWPEDQVRQEVPHSIRVVDFLQMENISYANRLWSVLQEEILDDQTLRRFACDCAERVLYYPQDEPQDEGSNDLDPRFVRAISVARSYALGEATSEQLRQAWEESMPMSWYCNESAAGSTTKVSAARAAWNASTYAYWHMGDISEREWQCRHLLEMIAQ